MSADDVARASITSRRKVVVIGAGFAGIGVVRELRDSYAEVTLVDRNNHHLFQPFLFQVARRSLSLQKSRCRSARF
jgi:NADH dehydrogenase